jgi:hypothetical protein
MSPYRKPAEPGKLECSGVVFMTNRHETDALYRGRHGEALCMSCWLRLYALAIPMGTIKFPPEPV